LHFVAHLFFDELKIAVAVFAVAGVDRVVVGG
jgi:hypothetical protein